MVFLWQGSSLPDSLPHSDVQHQDSLKAQVQLVDKQEEKQINCYSSSTSQMFNCSTLQLFHGKVTQSDFVDVAWY